MGQRDLYGDPYDVGVGADSYPTCQRLHNEQPLHRDERLDLRGSSRFVDVGDGLKVPDASARRGGT